MVLTALSLLLGEKADSDLIRHGHERLSVSGIFSLGDAPTESLLISMEEQGLDISENQLIVTRHVTKDGKSRALISGSPSTASILTTLSGELIEIHGQHGSLVLSKPNKQRELLDLSGGDALRGLLTAYQSRLQTFLELKRAIIEIGRAHV